MMLSEVRDEQTGARSRRRAARRCFAVALLAALVGVRAPALAEDTATHIHVGRAGGDALGVTVEDDARGQSIHVGHVQPGGAAARAGLQAGDRIVTVGGCRVRGAQDLNAALAAALPGTSIELGIVPARGNAAPRVPAADGPVSLPAGTGTVLLRLQFATGPGSDNGAPPVSDVARFVSAAGGVRLAGAPGALAPQLRRGDLIATIDSQPVTDGDQASALLTAPRAGGHVLVIVRDGKRLSETVGATSTDGARAVRTPDVPCRP